MPGDLVEGCTGYPQPLSPSSVFLGNRESQPSGFGESSEGFMWKSTLLVHFGGMRSDTFGRETAEPVEQRFLLICQAIHRVPFLIKEKTCPRKAVMA